MKYSLTLLSFQYTKNKVLNLKNIAIHLFPSKELALGTVYNQYGIPYVKEVQKSFICCNFQFGWVPTIITLAIVSSFAPNKFYAAYDLNDKFARQKIKKLLDDLIEINQKKDWGGSNTSYPDKSLEMAEWHWKYSMPKGYRLLEPGEVILESDCEYHDISSRNKCWSDVVSWYNVGKIVEERTGWCRVDKDNKVVASGGKETDPLICRKIDKATKEKIPSLQLKATHLLSQSFEGWSEDAINGYKTAVASLTKTD